MGIPLKDSKGPFARAIMEKQMAQLRGKMVCVAMGFPFTLTSSVEEAIVNPTIGQIAELLAELVDIEPAGNFLVLETDALKPGDGLHYMQTVVYLQTPYERVFLVEYEDGLTQCHYRTFVHGSGLLVGLFRSYLARDNAYFDMVMWRDMSLLLKHLQHQMPPDLLAASFWPDGEYERYLQKRKRMDSELWELWKKCNDLN